MAKVVPRKPLFRAPSLLSALAPTKELRPSLVAYISYVRWACSCLAARYLAGASNNGMSVLQVVMKAFLISGSRVGSMSAMGKGGCDVDCLARSEVGHCTIPLGYVDCDYGTCFFYYSINNTV